MTTWRYIDSGSNIAAYNMAVDEELLARAQAGGKTPVLRFYGWDPPAVSLGMFQKIEGAVNIEACRSKGFDIVKRITGGRAVLHYKELTYCIIARTDNPLFPSEVHGSYKVIAAALLAGLGNLGIAAEMVARGGRHAELVIKKDPNPSCFASPSWYEIVVHGRKLIGSAQRRLSGAFLQHGSILIDYDPDLEAEVIPGGGASTCITCINRETAQAVDLSTLKSAFRNGFEKALGIILQS